MSQDADSKSIVAFHLNAPAHIRRSLKLNVPILIVMRDPDAAILSQLMKAPSRNVHTAHNGYIDFYNYVLLLANKVVIATYDEVTSDFDAVIKKANSFYGIEFRPFEHTEDNIKKVFSRLDNHVIKHHGVTEVDEHKITRPTSAKKNLKDECKDIIEQKYFQSIRHEADALYQQILSSRN